MRDQINSSDLDKAGLSQHKREARIELIKRYHDLIVPAINLELSEQKQESYLLNRTIAAALSLINTCPDDRTMHMETATSTSNYTDTLYHLW